MVEQLTLNQRVTGSIPVRPTILCPARGPGHPSGTIYFVSPIPFDRRLLDIGKGADEAEILRPGVAVTPCISITFGFPSCGKCIYAVFLRYIRAREVWDVFFTKPVNRLPHLSFYSLVFRKWRRCKSGRARSRQHFTHYRHDRRIKPQGPKGLLGNLGGYDR